MLSSTEGKIGIKDSNSIYIGNFEGNNVGLRFIGVTNDIRPCTSSGDNQDNTIDLGDSSARFVNIYATNNVIQTSDIREKKQIKSTELGLNFINDLKPISYKWVNSVDKRNHQGLIAQEVAETLEKHGINKNEFGGLDIQKTDKYDDFYGMSYSELISPMIKAIQEQQTIIEDLKSRIETLEG